MLEDDASGAAAPLGETLDASFCTGSKGSVGGVDVRCHLFNKNIFALSVFDLWIIIPAHGASVWKDVYGVLNLSTSHGLLDKGHEGNGFAFRTGPSAM